MNRLRLALWVATILGLTACGERSRPDAVRDSLSGGSDAGTPIEIAHFPLSDAGVPAGADATFDPGVSQDGGGSLRVETARGGRLRLYELRDLGEVQGAVVYTGFLRSQGLDGEAMIELWCRPAEGEAAFVRSAGTSVIGDAEWTPQEIRFSRPELCRDPESVELNVLIRGAGTVWIDDLRLWSVPVE